MSLCPPPRQSNFQNSLNKALFFLNPVFITILWGYFGVIFKLQGNVFASQRKKKILNSFTHAPGSKSVPIGCF